MDGEGWKHPGMGAVRGGRDVRRRTGKIADGERRAGNPCRPRVLAWGGARAVDTAAHPRRTLCVLLRRPRAGGARRSSIGRQDACTGSLGTVRQSGAGQGRW